MNYKNRQNKPSPAALLRGIRAGFLRDVSAPPNTLCRNRNNASGFGGIAVIIVLTLLILAGIFIFGEGTASPNNQGGKTSQLQASEKIYDFGTISMAKGNVEKIFKVANPTDRDIFVKTVTTSCMCTSAYIVKDGSEKGPFKMPGMGYVPPANETIKAGGSMDIKVVYDPNAHGPAGVGIIDRFVYLADAEGGKIQLEIKANVTP